MALIGGDKNVRGYYYGRFRDKNLSSIQSEFRTVLFWRLGISVFGGISKVYSNTGDFDLNNLKPNYGFGLRFLMDKKEQINLRLDYARGSKNQAGFYVVFGESF